MINVEIENTLVGVPYLEVYYLPILFRLWNDKQIQKPVLMLSNLVVSGASAPE